jgi:hypothetical protein
MATWLGGFGLAVAEGSVGSSTARRPVIEFRVHGVSGTSPESLLDVPLVERVAGDGDAGLFDRRRRCGRCSSCRCRS